MEIVQWNQTKKFIQAFCYTFLFNNWSNFDTWLYSNKHGDAQKHEFKKYEFKKYEFKNNICLITNQI